MDVETSSEENTTPVFAIGIGIKSTILPSLWFWQAPAVSVSTLQKHPWMFSSLTSPAEGGRTYSLPSPLTRMRTITWCQKEERVVLFHSFIPVWFPTCSSVCFLEHTFLHMRSEVPSVLEHWPNVLCMNWPFLCRLWQLGFWRGGVSISLPSRADSCSFSLPSSPTEQPCASSASLECQHSCIYLAFTFWLFIASPHSWLLPQRSALFICSTFTHLLYAYVSQQLYLFFFAGVLRIDNFAAL